MKMFPWQLTANANS